MRTGTFLTPGTQALVGFFVLIACLTTPPLILLVLTVLIYRALARLRRGSRRGAYVTGVLILPVAVGLMYVFPPQYAPIFGLLALVTGAWFLWGRLRRPTPVASIRTTAGRHTQGT